MLAASLGETPDGFYDQLIDSILELKERIKKRLFSQTEPVSDVKAGSAGSGTGSSESFLPDSDEAIHDILLKITREWRASVKEESTGLETAIMTHDQKGPAEKSQTEIKEKTVAEKTDAMDATMVLPTSRSGIEKSPVEETFQEEEVMETVMIRRSKFAQEKMVAEEFSDDMPETVMMSPAPDSKEELSEDVPETVVFSPGSLPAQDRRPQELQRDDELEKTVIVSPTRQNNSADSKFEQPITETKDRDLEATIAGPESKPESKKGNDDDFLEETVMIRPPKRK
jgi:hypothetical protein